MGGYATTKKGPLTLAAGPVHVLFRDGQVAWRNVDVQATHR